MTDIFKVGAEAASFDGIETPDVELLLGLADVYRAEKARIVANFDLAVAIAAQAAGLELALAQDAVRLGITAARETHHD